MTGYVRRVGKEFMQHAFRKAYGIFTVILVCFTHLLVTKVFREVQRETSHNARGTEHSDIPETSRLFRYQGGCGSRHITSCSALGSGSLVMSPWRDSAVSEEIPLAVKTVQTHV